MEKQLTLNGMPEEPVNDGMLSIIERVARDPNSDIDKLERLLAMKERLDLRDAELAFSEAFANMKPALPVIRHDRYNDQTQSKYATLRQVNETVDPILKQHGFSTRFRTHQTETHASATCILQHIKGHKEETTITLPLDLAGIKGTKNKTSVHAVASSTTYAKRYAKLAALDLVTGDDDGNGAANELPLNETQQETIKSLLMGCSGVTRDWFAETYGSVAYVPRNHYTKLQAQLFKAKQQAEAANANS